jgi:hypothetical protein
MKNGHLESAEQIAVADYLRAKKALFTAVPHGGYRRPIEAAIMKAEGVVAGCPDLLIFTRTVEMVNRGRVGIAIEMKRPKGGRVSQEQATWIASLQAYGWVAQVCNGAGEALELLKKWGI